MRPFIALTALGLALASCARAPATVNDSHGEPASPVPAVAPQLIAQFDASAGELPEGLLLTADGAYVGFAPTSRVVRVDVSSGRATPYGELPAPISGKGFMTGLARSDAGEVYAGLASFVPEVRAGIYRIPRSGGKASLFASDTALPFPNALAFDSSGVLWATDSSTGSVFRIDEAGRAERWATSELLIGDKDACNGAGPGFPIGANGIVVEPAAIYVVNLDKASLVKLPRDAAGSAGTPVILAGPDCDALGGADGLARAPDGSFVVAVNRQDKIVRVNDGGGVETIAHGAPFDFPASVAYEGSSLFVTNFALENASAGRPASPGLVKLGL